MTAFVCPEAEHHGNPFRYCGVKGCGWMEETPPPLPVIQRCQSAWADPDGFLHECNKLSPHEHEHECVCGDRIDPYPQSDAVEPSERAIGGGS